MQQYKIDGYVINTYHINENGQEWAAWNDEGDPRYVYASSEQLAISMLLDILRESDRVTTQGSMQIEAFGRPLNPDKVYHSKRWNRGA